MKKYFDIAVIGAGAGGLNIASFCNGIGLSVLLIDQQEERIGGDCLNFGCIPSKALIHIARQFKAQRETVRFGGCSAGLANMRLVRDYIRGTQEKIRTHENATYFRSKGMVVAIGTAQFVSPQAVKVGAEIYHAKRLVIATGSRPRELTIPGIERVKEHSLYHTNETIFSLDVLPKKLLVIGGGPIGVELGQAFSHLGSQVSIVTPEDRILPREDGRVSQILEDALRQDGVTVYTNEQPERFETARRLTIRHTKTGAEQQIDFDVVLVAIGRDISLGSLSVEKAGIAVDDKGRLILDTALRTTNKNVFACGDVVGQHQFTHAAELHAGVIIRNFFRPFLKTKNKTEHLGAVTYTSPEVATFGLSEVELKKRNVAYCVLEDDFSHDDRAITAGGTSAYAKLLVTKKGKILGGTMVAHEAGELVQELMLAQSAGITTKAIFNKNYPYPTASRINKKLVTDEARQRLTKPVQAWLRRIYRLW